MLGLCELVDLIAHSRMSLEIKGFSLVHQKSFMKAKQPITGGQSFVQLWTEDTSGSHVVPKIRLAVIAGDVLHIIKGKSVTKPNLHQVLMLSFSLRSFP
jgi:hypothetical protein